MLRSILGRLVEWALGYRRDIIVTPIDYHQPDGPAYFPVKFPHHSHEDDAGYDLYVSRWTLCRPGGVTEVPSGIAISPKAPVWFEIKARSSTFRNMGLEVLDAVIDHGYRGEMFAIVFNPGPGEVALQPWTRICQIVPHLLLPVRFHWGRVLPSDRGRSGFGSTGS